MRVIIIIPSSSSSSSSSHSHSPTTTRYEELAVDLALNMDRLWEIRKKLEDARESCALFDTARFVRNLEKGMSEVWSLHERGDPKGHVQVRNHHRES